MTGTTPSHARRTEGDETAEGDSHDQTYGLGRVLAISDGVFAFAMTLLVVQLAVPLVSNDRSLATGLLEQVPSYVSYALSFGVIALTWYGHHETFRHIRRYDGRLIALNFGSLLLIAVLPFPTAVLGRYGNQPLAAVIYATTLSLTGLLAAVTWRYATHRHRLVSKDLDPQLVRYRFYRSVIIPVVFLLSIPVAVWRPAVAETIWWLSLIVTFTLISRLRPRTTAKK
jgi:uncharacterized membrane protein